MHLLTADCVRPAARVLPGPAGVCLVVTCGRSVAGASRLVGLPVAA